MDRVDEGVEAHFDREAGVYDDLILRLIPGYLEQHRVVESLVPGEPTAPIRVLDLGAGTGALSLTVLGVRPNATVDVVDISSGMLEQCAASLAGYSGAVRFIQEDMASFEPRGPYDLAVSGLAIHHLDDPEKRRVFGRVHEALSPGGIFVVREVVVGETAQETERLHEEWRAFIRSQGEDDARWFAKYLQEDRPASLEAQLGWMRDIGFADVACRWRRGNFAVFAGARRL